MNRFPNKPLTALAAATALLTSARAQDPVPAQPIPTVAEQMAAFTVADGFEVNLFASEADAPIANPTAQAFDARGRLWVATSTTFPHYLPGQTPRDKIVVLEDTDRDGRADKHTVFADHLLIPTGIAVDTDGVYVAQQSRLLFLQDTDGDGVADRRTVVAHGFGTEDSHHAPSAFTWGPEGSFYFCEGIFHHAQVETPWGPQRLVDGGVHRFTPRTLRTTTVSHRAYYNPWGIAFDRWGQAVLSDASDGQHYHLSAVSAAFRYPEKSVPAEPFLRRGRPMAGNLILSSNHFPPDLQGTHLNCQSLGFNGVRHDRLAPQGSGWTSGPLPDLVSSSNPNFRPVALDTGPDGAIYVLDYCNPRIGHMYFQRADEDHDRSHGRVWRITASGRPPLTPPSIVGQPIPTLLGLLKAHENHTRHFARRELAHRNAADVSAALATWITELDREAPGYTHHLLEALWVAAGHGSVQNTLLTNLVHSRDPNARAAAVRQLRLWLQDGLVPSATALRLLASAVEDASEPVRLEAVVALGFIPSPASASLVAKVATRPMDQNTRAALEQTLRALARYSDAAAIDAARLAASIDPTDTTALVAALADASVTPQTVDELGPLLLAQPHDDLLPHRTTLARLAATPGPARLTALAALSTADGHFDAAVAAAPDAPHLAFDALALVGADTLARLRPALLKAAADTGHPARAAAVRHLGRLPGEPRPALTILSPLLTKTAPDDLRFAAAEALADLPEQHRPGKIALTNFLRDLQVAAVPQQLLFQPAELTAAPGQPVRLTFSNPDALPHNLLVIKPDTRSDVAAAAAAMLSLPGDAATAAGFVPDHPAVIHATPLLLQGDTHTLRFHAPGTPGDYPFLCTFPGHAALMHGVLKIR